MITGTHLSSLHINAQKKKISNNIYSSLGGHIAASSAYGRFNGFIMDIINHLHNIAYFLASDFRHCTYDNYLNKLFVTVIVIVIKIIILKKTA